MDKRITFTTPVNTIIKRIAECHVNINVIKGELYRLRGLTTNGDLFISTMDGQQIETKLAAYKFEVVEAVSKKTYADFNWKLDK
jgi:hypothetical protein